MREKEINIIKHDEKEVDAVIEKLCVIAKENDLLIAFVGDRDDGNSFGSFVGRANLMRLLALAHTLKSDNKFQEVYKLSDIGLIGHKEK